MDEPQVIARKLLSLRICVPKEMTDEQIKEWVDKENPCGTTNGWVLVEQGSPVLLGTDAVIQCATRPDCNHRVVTAA